MISLSPLGCDASRGCANWRRKNASELPKGNCAEIVSVVNRRTLFYTAAFAEDLAICHLKCLSSAPHASRLGAARHSKRPCPCDSPLSTAFVGTAPGGGLRPNLGASP